MGTLLRVRISWNNPCQQAYFSKCRGLRRQGWRVESMQGSGGKGRISGKETEQRWTETKHRPCTRKEGIQQDRCLFLYCSQVYTSRTTCKLSICHTVYSMLCALVLYCMLSFLHVRVWQTKKKKKRPRASAETDSSQCLQQAQSPQANVYLHHTVPERRWHQSIPFWQGSWDNSWLWFPAITPANQKERHHDYREPQACVIRAYCVLQSI